ncbi:MAG: PEP-CTERM sorting domain-containing protein [Terriglobales bacterium]
MRAAVPEPGVLAALGSGLVGLAAVVRRRLGR